MNAPVRMPLSGEILSPEAKIDVILALHPLSGEKEIIKAPSGASVAEIVAGAEERKRSRIASFLRVYVEGELVPREWWSRTRVKRGPVLIRAVAEGDIWRTVLGVVVAVAAIAATVFLGPIIGPFLAAAVAVGVTIGGTLAINALFPITPPRLSISSGGEKTSVTYSIGGGRNEADLYGPVPVILGRHRVAPKYAAAPYTEFIGEEQYLRMLFCWGYGELAISDIKIGETPIAEFEDVTIETRLGTGADAVTTLYPKEVVQQDLTILLASADGFQLRTTATLIDEISIDVVAAGGIYTVNATSGALENYTVNVAAEYRLFGSGGAWTSLGTIVFTSRSRDAIRRSLRAVVTRGQYDVRVQKTTTDTVSDQVSDEVMWTALRGIRNDPPLSFDSPIAVTALRIRATAQLNGVIDSLNGIVASKGKKWNGSTWVANQASRNPADLFRLVLQHPANKRPVPDAKIDLTTLQLWHAYCAAQDFAFDMVRDFRSSVFECLADIAAAGRAAVLFRDGKWSVVWDNASAPVVDHYTPRDSWGFSSSRLYRRLPHGWRIRFINEEKGWQQDERVVYDDGYTSANATLLEAIEFPGVTRPNNIWKHGRFHIAQVRLRPEIYKLTVDARQLIVTRGDRVRINHDVPLFGLTAGRVKAVAGQSITLDEPVIMETGKTYGVRFLTNNGTSLLRSVTLDVGQQTIINLIGTSTVPEVGNGFMFGESGEESVILRVRSIAHAEDFQATLTLVDDVPKISTADTGTIPDFDSHITVPPDPSTLAPFNLVITERLFRDPTTGGAVVAVLFAWQVLVTGNVDRFEVQYRDDTNGQWKAAGTVLGAQPYLEILGLQNGAFSFRVRSIFEDGTPSAWGTLSAQTLVGLGVVPANVTGFKIAVIDDLATLTWDPVLTPGLSHYVIRFTPTLIAAAWASASVLQPRVDATSVQVPTLVGSYLIKAVTISDLESTLETVIVSAIAGLRTLNAVETFDPAPTWTGTLTDVDEVGGALELLWSGSAFPPEGLFTSDQTLDLGEIFVSRVSVVLDAEGDNVSNVIGSWVTLASISTLSGANAAEWQARVEERHTPDDPGGSPTWSDWAELQVGDVLARAFQFRLRLISFNPAVTPVVSSMAVSVDMPDRIVAGNDLAVGTGGLTITFDPDFRELQGLGIAAQNLATGDYSVITAKTEAGFTIIFRNAGGSAVARTFDYVAKGYGAVL